MKMVCRECGRVHSSEEIKKSGRLVYVSGDSDNAELWKECMVAEGCEMDKLDVTVIGYDGCLGWP